ncbi:hypothetical protein ABVT39_014658 [Epinephelus coioides]
MKVQGQISHALHHEFSDGMNPAVNTEQQRNMDVVEELAGALVMITTAAEHHCGKPPPKAKSIERDQGHDGIHGPVFGLFTCHRITL